MPKTTETAHPLSEADFLDQQAAAAKAAIGRALADAKAALGQGVDPRELARGHPFIAIGSAVAAGFVTAWAVVPSRHEQALRELRRVREALNPKPEPAEPKPSNGQTAEPHSIWLTILHEVVALAKPVLTAMLSAGFQNFARPPAPDHNGNGFDQPANDNVTGASASPSTPPTA